MFERYRIRYASPHKRISSLILTRPFATVYLLVFVDAPVILHPVDLANTFSDPNNASSDATNSLAAFGAAEAADADKTDDPALIPRAWWKTNWDRTSTDGMEESIEFLKSVLVKGPRFDVSELTYRRNLGWHACLRRICGL